VPTRGELYDLADDPGGDEPLGRSALRTVRSDLLATLDDVMRRPWPRLPLVCQAG
jgi:hypothetical protein